MPKGDESWPYAPGAPKVSFGVMRLAGIDEAGLGMNPGLEGVDEMNSDLPPINGREEPN